LTDNSRDERAECSLGVLTNLDTKDFDLRHMFIQELNDTAELPRQFIRDEEKPEWASPEIRVYRAPVLFDAFRMTHSRHTPTSVL